MILLNIASFKIKYNNLFKKFIYKSRNIIKIYANNQIKSLIIIFGRISIDSTDK